jgi:hypothetical protein
VSAPRRSRASDLRPRLLTRAKRGGAARLLAIALVLAVLSCDGPVDTEPAYLVSECLDCGETAQSRCRDALDNDEDGLSDCDDPDCAGAYACLARGPESTAERCADGLDNDENGFTDCGDFGCRSTSACRTPVKIDENTPATCADGLDDDWDGRIDCEDSDCALAETVTSCEGSNARCSDGVDNDGNGFTDCSDFSCSRGDSVTVCQ